MLAIEDVYMLDVVNRYKLNELIPCLLSMNHFESYSHIKEWLESEIEEVTIKVNASIHQDLEPPTVPRNTSHRNHPNLAIYSNGRT